MPTPDALRLVDETFLAFAARSDGPPGVAWGVVAAGALAHAGGTGTLRVGEERRPDQASVFRIASMTKSFTAAAILRLRDAGRLALDDPVGRHVPALADLRGPTRDAPPLTIRHLLTMTGGLPYDDPLGDRLQAMPLDAFGALLAGGLTFSRTPGTAFEYSNLGYGILGRVVTNTAGREYRHVVEDELLRPLGMTASTFDPGAVPADRSAQGYVRRDERWELEPIDGYGALASMGGLFSSVEDLARWVAWLAAAFPPRDEPDGGMPLSRAARREMQQVQRVVPPALAFDGSGGAPALEAGGYGFGLFVGHDPELGTVVAHGGGYPGFGSTMRWHPATGLGVVALANARYARLGGPGAEALRALVRAAGLPPRRGGPAPATERLRVAADELIRSWDDDRADAVFAANMDLDEPRERRRAEVAEAIARLGPLDRDGEPPASDAPGHAAWWLRGQRGRLRVELLATFEVPPRIQQLAITVVPDPPEALRAVAASVAALLAEDAPVWPADLRLAPGVAAARLERGLRAAALALGPATLGRPVAGDGERTLTIELEGERGRGELRLEVDAAGSVVRAAVVPEPITPPPDPA